MPPSAAGRVDPNGGQLAAGLTVVNGDRITGCVVGLDEHSVRAPAEQPVIVSEVGTYPRPRPIPPRV